jgi:hypothetical protein
MCETVWGSIIRSMSTSTYILDSALVLLVILQMKERVLTNMALLRPVVILTIAVASYFTAFPTQGNDIPLVAAIAGVGAVLGTLSGFTVMMRRNGEGEVTARAGLSSAAFWVLGMGGRFAFSVWAFSAAGAVHIAHFSAGHSITGADVWTDALLAMAVAEVLSRTLVMVIRRSQLQHTTPHLAIA